MPHTVNVPDRRMKERRSMTETAAQLKTMLSQLSANDRAELTRFLIDSLDGRE
jgi:hypothetical protein